MQEVDDLKRERKRDPGKLHNCTSQFIRLPDLDL
jgi:hypothetical protein